MIIRPIDKKNNYVGLYGFTSFKEVFDWCLCELKKTEPRGDDILFRFEIRTSGEIFYLHGTPKGEDSVLYNEFYFEGLFNERY